MVDYGELFDFPYQAAALYDGAWGNAILSRFPIAKSEEMHIYNRSGPDRADRPGPTAASRSPPIIRIRPLSRQQGARFRAHADRRDRPLILCGDLNCINPDDKIDRSRLVTSFRAFTSNAEIAVDRLIESGRMVFGALGELGLRDAIPPAGRRYSIRPTWPNADKGSGVRIDHILVNAAIEVAAGEVVHSPASNLASDHHPVMIEFRLRG
ncbi:MAG: endonuclease/exonuclease/phosphatase family protein [Pseudomonadota bacterium]